MSQKASPSVTTKTIRFRDDVFDRLQQLAEKFDLTDNAACQMAIIRWWEAEFPERAKKTSQ